MAREARIVLVHKGEPVAFTSFAVLTCEPNSLVAPLHDRMPAILRSEEYERWLFDDWESALKAVGPYLAATGDRRPVNLQLWTLAAH